MMTEIDTGVSNIDILETPDTVTDCHNDVVSISHMDTKLMLTVALRYKTTNM